MTQPRRHPAKRGDRARPDDATRRAARARPGFTFLELHVSLAILVMGLLSLAWLVTAQSKQVARTEAWCVGDPNYYVVGHTSKWMRKLGAPAQIETQAGQEAWTPPVSGPPAYVPYVQSSTEDADAQTLSIQVVLQPAGG